MGKFHISTQILQGNALFSGKIYTVVNIFTRPPVVTVATNSSLFGRYLLLSGFCRNGGLRGYPSANSREDGSPATWDCGNGGQLEGKLSLIYWRGCTYISVSKQNISFLKIKRCSPFLWGLIWRIPKGFLILTSFGGCTRPSKICLS